MTEIFDSSDPKAVKRAIKDSKQKGARLSEALRGIMASPNGRAWMHALIEFCDPHGSSLASEPHMTYYNLGVANVGKKLIADLHACSTELYLQMMKEASDDRPSNDSSSDDKRDLDRGDIAVDRGE